MRGFLTQNANNQVLDFIFGGQSFSPPTTYYVGLSKDRSSRSGSITEVTGGSYARVAVANTLVSFPTTTTGVKTNGIVIAFPAPTALWGMVESLFLSDAVTGGNVWFVSDLAVLRTVQNGDPAPTFAIGAMVIQDS